VSSGGRQYACRRIKLVAGPSWLASLQISSAWRTGHRGHLRLNGAWMVVELPNRPAIAIPRSLLASGFRAPESNQVLLQLSDGGQVELELAPGADDPLDELRADLEKSTLEIKLHRRPELSGKAWLVAFWGLFSLLALTSVLWEFIGIWTLLVPVILVSAIAFLMRRRSIAVGVDGVVFRGLRERLLRFEDIASVDDNIITMKSGKQVSIPGSRSNDARAAALLGLEEAFAAYRSKRPDSLEADLLRGDQTLEAWQRQLGAKAAPATFRHTSTSPEELEAVLSNPTTGVEQRLGAAIALASRGGAEKVRIAARSSIDEKVRVALEAAAEGELDEEQFTDAVEHDRAKVT
jgi:hypothetical protein